MAYSPAAIRSSIKALLLGQTGSVRTVPVNTLAYGTFEGQAPGATRSRALDPQFGSRFDVRFGAQKMHPATPISAKASMKLALLPVQIDITTKFRSPVAEAERDFQRAAAESRADLALQALEYPGNLRLDGEGNATGVVSGMLMGPDGTGHPSWEVLAEDWKTLHHLSRISGGVVVVIDQPVTESP